MDKDLKSYLEENGLSREAFAAQIGVSAVSVTRYLNGNRFPTPTVLSAIERVTGQAVLASSFLTKDSASTDM